MANYIVLANFTDQGLRSVKETTSRADAVKEAAAKFSCKMKDIYWVQGQYDIVTVLESQDEQSAAAFGLWLAGQGNVKMQTLRAFSRDEMASILKKL